MKIKVRAKVVLLLFLNFCIGCKSQIHTKDELVSVDSKYTNNATKDDDKQVIKLYHVDSVFISLMPDTGRRFATNTDRKNYFITMMKRYREFKKSLKGVPDKNDEDLALSIRNADIMYDDYMLVINFNFIKTAPKDNMNMALLSLYSPCSNLVSYKSVIDLYEMFPQEIKDSEIGKKTQKVLDEYNYTKNLGTDLTVFSKLTLLNRAAKKSAFKEILPDSRKYTVLVFGASWCLPCRLEELQLKKWYHLIDTSSVKITGLSIDGSIDKWKKYVNADQFPWPMYLLEGEMNNSVIRRLNFEGVPRNFLVDSNGYILAENTDIRKILKQVPAIKTSSDYIN